MSTSSAPAQSGEDISTAGTPGRNTHGFLGRKRVDFAKAACSQEGGLAFADNNTPASYIKEECPNNLSVSRQQLNGQYIFKQLDIALFSKVPAECGKYLFPWNKQGAGMTHFRIMGLGRDLPIHSGPTFLHESGLL